jgi:NADP-dependent 3-hydroxy acid dehydrogenase YdfG
MNSRTKLVVLITGCSSGIGKATAERLLGAGHTVYATARRVESLESLRAKGCKVLALDVTSEESSVAAVAAIESAEGRIDVLVNNAGFSQSGALETLSVDQVRGVQSNSCS